MPEIVKTIGTILGYIATAIGLYVLIRNRVLKGAQKYVVRESGLEKNKKADAELLQKVEELTERFNQFVEEDTAFRLRMQEHIASQNDTNRKLLANIIEQTYYSNRDKKCLDRNEFKRISEVYEIYSSEEVHGNSYISALVAEMMDTWEKLP